MPDKPPRLCTPTQLGDACEMLVAAELTLAGVPAMKVPHKWPGYDVIAQPHGGATPLRVSVKARTFKAGGTAFVSFNEHDAFDWLAVVILPREPSQERRIYLIPAQVAQRQARRGSPTAKTAHERYWRIDEVHALFERFQNNFKLYPDGTQQSHPHAPSPSNIPPPPLLHPQ